MLFRIILSERSHQMVQNALGFILKSYRLDLLDKGSRDNEQW